MRELTDEYHLSMEDDMVEARIEEKDWEGSGASFSETEGEVKTLDEEETWDPQFYALAMVESD